MLGTLGGARSAPQLSIVTTMYRSTAYLHAFHARAARAAESLFSDIEFVYVNDGSPDDSLRTALALADADGRVRVVDLSRNFGHHRAMLAGLEHARGDFVFLIDCDLEEEPECLATLFEALRSNPDADVAFGVQAARKGGAVERLGGAAAYGIINAMAGDLHLTPNMLVVRLMTRRYVDALLLHPESEVTFSGIAATTGFRQLAVPVPKHSKGTSTYTIAKRAAMLLRGITAFSDRPLIYIAYVGFGIVASSALYVTYLIAVFFAYRSVPAGFTSLAVSIWLLGGLILLSVGIVAVYLSVIFMEVKHRPRYVVRAVYERTRVGPQTDG